MWWHSKSPVSSSMLGCFYWRKQSFLRLPIVFSYARGQCKEMEMVIAMQSVKVVMQRGSQKVVRNLHLTKKGKWHVIMSFIIWWISMIFSGARRKRSMAWTGWNKLKDVYSVGGCLWLEMNDDSLSKHKLPLIVKFVYYCLWHNN